MTYSALALDQSQRNTAWAHIAKGDDRPTFGMFELPPWQDMEGEQLWKFMEWLGVKCTDLKVSHLFLENTFTPQDHHESLTDKIAVYGMIGMAAVVEYLMNKKGHPLELAMVATGQWRPKFIGAEKAPEGLVKHQKRAWLKQKSIEACHKRNWAVANDNEADACGILTFGVSTIDLNFMVNQGALFRRAETAVQLEKRELK